MTKKIWIANDPCAPDSFQWVELFTREPKARGVAGWEQSETTLCREEIERFLGIDIPKDLGKDLLEIEVDVKSKILCTWKAV